MIDPNKLSTENLRIVQKVIEIVFDELEFQDIDILLGNKISKKSFEKEDLSREKIEMIFDKIVDGENQIISIDNKYIETVFDNGRSIDNEIERLKKENSSMDETTIRHLFWNIYGVRHEYSKDYILLTIKNYNKLKDFEKAIEDTLAERVKTYADNERTKETVKEKEFEFNYSKCQFFYKGEVYRPRNETKREFIKKLWEKHHKQNNKKQIITQGERLPESYFAIKINMIREVREFENKRTKRRFKETKKELNRIFRDKKFPIKIDSNKEGLLLIRTIQ